MNEKLNIQDLIDLLAEKHGMSKKNADSFVKEFFLLIEEALEKDKYVKVKGLGTFKLIDVDSRESVNVNTGERFEIHGHSKISFTPEPALKEIINKPFSHFETVVLNDDTVFEDVPLEGDNDEEEDVESTNREKPVSEPSIAAIKREEALKIEAEMIGGKTPANSATMKFFAGIVLFVVVLCVGAIVFLCYPDMFEGTPVKAPAQEVVKSETDILRDNAELVDTLASKNTHLSDTVVPDKSLVADSQKEVVTQERLAPKSETESRSSIEESIVAPAGYTFTGTETIYTVGDGETLTKISLDFYGSKKLWSYIVKYNPDVIKNPDYVPAGTKIKIPKLVKKQ